MGFVDRVKGMLGMKPKASEGVVPLQPGAPPTEGRVAAPTNLGEGDKLYGGGPNKEVFAPNTGVNLEGTSLASLPTRETGVPTAPVTPETATPAVPVSPEGGVPVK